MVYYIMSGQIFTVFPLSCSSYNYQLSSKARRLCRRAEGGLLGL